MRSNSLVFGVCLALGLFAVPFGAAADIAPAGLCASDEVGEACEEAVAKDGTELGEPGICVAEQCTRGTPSGPMKYACVMCRPESTEPTEGGAGGASNHPLEPSAGAAGKPAGPTEGGSAGNGPSPAKPTAGSGSQDSPAKGGSASTAGTTSKDTDDSQDDAGCSVGMGGSRSGVVTVSSLLALALVLGRRRLQRRA